MEEGGHQRVSTTGTYRGRGGAGNYHLTGREGGEDQERDRERERERREGEVVRDVEAGLRVPEKAHLGMVNGEEEGV